MKKLLILFLMCAATVVARALDITVNTPGTMAQTILENVENWSDVTELSVSGHLNDDDMQYFSRMSNLTTLNLSQTDITEINGCENLAKLKTVVLPSTTTVIGNGAFSGCKLLSDINLENIAEIGNAGFYHCESLATELNLENLTVIGSNAFYYCYSLKSISFPNVTIIGSQAFYYCESLDVVYLPKCKSIGDYSFCSCSLKQSVVLSDDIQEIPERAFYCSGIKSFQFPKNLKRIRRSAFDNSQLASAIIPEGVTTINDYAFNYCPLSSVSLPSTLTYVSYGAFSSSLLSNVWCYCVVPPSSWPFSDSSAKNATLHVPAFSVTAYKMDENWYKFNKIEAIEGELSDVTINNTFVMTSSNGLADNANLTLNSTEATNNSEQPVGHLTLSTAEPLSFNNFVQNHNFKYVSDWYYDENGYEQTRNGYPYCTTLIANSEARANSVTVGMSLPKNQWSFISLPNDVNVNDIVAPEGALWVIRQYNGENRAAMSGDTWQNVESGQTLQAGKGYILHCTDNNYDDSYLTFSFPALNNANKNNIFANNDITKTLEQYPSEFSHNRGWNLIGNPYPAYLSSDAINFPAPITVWNGSGYTAYSLTDDCYNLRPHEAFFVQCPVKSSVIKFLKEGRLHKYNGTYTPAKAPRRISANADRTVLNFLLSANGYTDRARLVINPDALADYEIECDASKFLTDNTEVPQIYTLDGGIRYAINERPLGSGEFALGVIGTEGLHSIALDTPCQQYNVLLTDHLTGDVTDLNSAAYRFNGTAKADDKRFSITVTANNSGADIESVATVSGLTEVYTIDGKRLSDTSTLQRGVYIIRTNGLSQKVYIK